MLISVTYSIFSITYIPTYNIYVNYSIFTSLYSHLHLYLQFNPEIMSPENNLLTG